MPNTRMSRQSGQAAPAMSWIVDRRECEDWRSLSLGMLSLLALPRQSRARGDLLLEVKPRRQPERDTYGRPNLLIDLPLAELCTSIQFQKQLCCVSISRAGHWLSKSCR